MRSRWFWIAPLFFLAACATVQYTGRKQFNLIATDQEIELGQQAYAQVLKENKLSNNAAYQQRIRAIGARIQVAAQEPSFQWEFNVLQGQQVNAFCLPGGKVAFWDAIMPICGDDAGVAVVMGHEVAHALAHHGAERMTQGMGVEILGQVLAIGFGKSDPARQQSILQYFGIGANVGLLKYSRDHESEADHIGLILMAKAGYDPRVAVDFWRRMAAASNGQKPPEFLSTHPSDDTRIRQIEEWLPEALSYYKQP
jgi:predicted Zn-dependent protease